MNRTFCSLTCPLCLLLCSFTFLLFPSQVGDKSLAQSAQMYHYQHQKQQMLSMGKWVVVFLLLCFYLFLSLSSCLSVFISLSLFFLNSKHHLHPVAVCFVPLLPHRHWTCVSFCQTQTRTESPWLWGHVRWGGGGRRLHRVWVPWTCTGGCGHTFANTHNIHEYGLCWFCFPPLQTGEMEVKNPLFDDSTLPVQGNHKWMLYI